MSTFILYDVRGPQLHSVTGVKLIHDAMDRLASFMRSNGIGKAIVRRIVNGEEEPPGWMIMRSPSGDSYYWKRMVGNLPMGKTPTLHECKVIA